jgi:hypothetical protein
MPVLSTELITKILKLYFHVDVPSTLIAPSDIVLSHAATLRLVDSTFLDIIDESYLLYRSVCLRTDADWLRYFDHRKGALVKGKKGSPSMQSRPRASLLLLRSRVPPSTQSLLGGRRERSLRVPLFLHRVVRSSLHSRLLPERPVHRSRDQDSLPIHPLSLLYRSSLDDSLGKLAGSMGGRGRRIRKRGKDEAGR